MENVLGFKRHTTLSLQNEEMHTFLFTCRGKVRSGQDDQDVIHSSRKFDTSQVIIFTYGDIRIIVVVFAMKEQCIRENLHTAFPL